MESNIIKDHLTLSLPPELAGVAAKELNETPDNRIQALKELRKSLEDEERAEDKFLLRFLRCKKFNVARALSVYKGYHSFRRDNPRLFEDLCPHGVRHIWEAGVLGALPHRDKKGRAVMVVFPGRWDPERHSHDDLMRAMILQLEHLITSVETQINGIVLIGNFDGFSFHQARCIKTWYFQLLTSLVQNAFPARFKGVFILNQPWYISFIMAVVSRIISEKMKSRIHMLGSNTSLLEESFNMDRLPTEFGGTQGNYNTMTWTETMLAQATPPSL